MSGSHPQESRATILLTFTVSERLCAVPVAAVREIVALPELEQAPEQPPLLEGFLNLRGIAIPVVRLDRLFGWTPSDPGLYSHIVVLSGAASVGLLVNRAEMLTRAPDAIAPLDPEDSLNGCAEALIEQGERTVHMLACDRILLAYERRRLDDFRDREQERLDRLEPPKG